jgi:16S rRNA (uracil1498-N3)-methyltransferase
MHLLFIENSQWIDYQSKKILIEEDEANHIIRVLRLQIGASLTATDGFGNWFEGTLVEVGKRNCMMHFDRHISEKDKRTYHLHIAIAPTKNIKRFEWFLEKATEMGIDEITPLICAHSERREVKIEHSKKVITAALKQSLKAYHPQLNEAIKFNDFIKTDFKAEKIIAHLISNEQISLKQSYQKGKDVCILIGPEGDFSPAEIQMAQENGYLAVRLGNERLRTETAAMVACNTIHFINE